MSSQQHHAPRRPLHALLVLFMAAAIGLSTAACGGANAKKADTPAVAGKPAPITAEEVDAMYALYLGGRYDAGWVYLYYVDLDPAGNNGAVDARVVYNDNTVVYTDVNKTATAGTYARMSVVDIYEQVGKMVRTDLGWVSTDDLL